MTKITNKNSSTAVVTTDIGYLNPSSTTTTSLVHTWKNTYSTTNKTYTYAYDNRGNITSISDGTTTTTYVYDQYDQLLRENNQEAGKTWVYDYDTAGNILSKTEYSYTTGELGTAIDTITYGYTDETWHELLTSYDGNTVSYDGIGNMLSDGTWTYTWEHGRQLATTTDGTTSVSYEYNSDGMRLSKTVGSTKTEYYYVGSQLVEMTQGSNKLHFTYDATGASAVTYNGTNYYYVKNAQGDIIGIVNTSGTVVVSYTYDAWGNVLSVTGSMASTLGALNPLRYRGYVYDAETGLYYLQTRYYDPSIGRFICADVFTSTGQGTIAANMYAYCLNNPIKFSDPTGRIAEEIILLAIKMTQIKNRISKKIVDTNVSSITRFSTSEELFPPIATLFVSLETGVVNDTTVSDNNNTPLLQFYCDGVVNKKEESAVGFRFTIFNTCWEYSLSFSDTGLSFAYMNGDTSYAVKSVLNLTEAKLGIEFSQTTTTSVVGNTSNSTTAYTNFSITPTGILAIIFGLYTGDYSGLQYAMP